MPSLQDAFDNHVRGRLESSFGSAVATLIVASASNAVGATTHAIERDDYVNLCEAIASDQLRLPVQVAPCDVGAFLHHTEQRVERLPLDPRVEQRGVQEVLDSTAAVQRVAGPRDGVQRAGDHLAHLFPRAVGSSQGRAPHLGIGALEQAPRLRDRMPLRRPAGYLEVELERAGDPVVEPAPGREPIDAELYRSFGGDRRPFPMPAPAPTPATPAPATAP